MKFFTTSLLFLAASLSSVSAVPADVSPLDVYAPKITYPQAGTVWVTGQTQNVTWDASNPPKQITNPIGQIWLRHDGGSDTKNPLAQGFKLTDGSAEVVVPDVAAGIYQLVLFGDSGNVSPEFTILNTL